MKLNKKIRNNKGSAMILAIIVMFLVSIAIMMFSSQVSNVIRTNMRSQRDMQAKYNLESGVENMIGIVCDQIEKKISEKLEEKSKDKVILVKQPYPGFTSETSEKWTISITIDPIKISNTNYSLKEPINIKLDINIKNRIRINENKEIVDRYYKLESITPTEKNELVNTSIDNINVTTNKDDKTYTINSEIEFLVKEVLKSGNDYVVKSAYNVIDWNK